MKREYIRPEAELIKFVEEEDIMTGPDTSTGVYNGDIPDQWN